MSEVAITLVIAIISSPIWIPLFEYVRNKVWARINFHGWQVIFLHTPEGMSTYFGHITSISRSEVALRDIYYLTDGNATPENIDLLEGPQLTKLGEGQLHQPEDIMIINRQYIVFMENMTDEAPVMKAINKYQNSKKK